MRKALLALLTAVAACAAPAKAPPATAAPAAPAPPKSALDWADGAVFYEVFVRSFQDSNGDGKGDLQGLISRLDYLNDGDPATDGDLGIDAIWLMPVFVSPSYHGYDTTDYENINPDYGTNADFERLVGEAHRRGIKIVVDLVLNHTSREHPWFVDSASSPSSPKRDWYVWSPTDLGWGQPWNAAGQTWHKLNDAYYYGVFWGGMPDLNHRNPAVRAETQRIAALWLARGVDGFRLDATRHLVETGPDDGQSDTAETHAVLRELAAAVRAASPRALLIGENWTDTPIIARYFGDTGRVPGGDELPLNFDFPLAARIIAAARQGQASLVAEKIAEIERTYPAGATWVPFLTNHDMIRVATSLKEHPGQLRTAAAVLLTLPGTPFLYYGEEIGLLNGPGGEDESKRTPMPWDGSENAGFTTAARKWRGFAPRRELTNVAVQTGDPASLLSHYRRLIRARKASRALARGQLSMLSGDGPVLAYTLTEGDERVLVAHNLVAEPQALSLAVAGAADPPLFAADGVTLAAEAGGVRVSLPPHASAVWRLGAPSTR
jgi:glycosidase